MARVSSKSRQPTRRIVQAEGKAGKPPTFSHLSVRERNKLRGLGWSWARIARLNRALAANDKT